MPLLRPAHLAARSRGELRGTEQLYVPLCTILPSLSIVECVL